MTKIPSERWIEKMSAIWTSPGNPSSSAFTTTQATSFCNIIVLTESWALGMGPRVNLGFVPKKMAHFGYAKVETTLQVHGIGLFLNLEEASLQNHRCSSRVSRPHPVSQTASNWRSARACRMSGARF